MDPAARTRVIRYVAAICAAAAVGIVLIAVSEKPAVDVVGIVLLGGALVVAVAAVFLEVGLSEDREREAARRGRDGADGPG